MDNNFNQQQTPAQPVYQQQMPAGQPVPQQQMPAYQQAQMPAGQPMYQQVPQQQAQMPGQPVYQQAPKKPSNINIKELVALICSGVGTLLAVLGSIFTCSCSASKTYDADDMMNNVLGSLNSLLGGSSSGTLIDHSTSAVMIIALIGAVIAVVGVVFGILAIKDKNATVKAGKMSYIAIAVGVFGFMYGVLPVLTICGYNCSLDSSAEDVLSFKK